jgi:hypothetical protein
LALASFRQNPGMSEDRRRDLLALQIDQWRSKEVADSIELGRDCDS